MQVAHLHDSLTSKASNCMFEDLVRVVVLTFTKTVGRKWASWVRISSWMPSMHFYHHEVLTLHSCNHCLNTFLNTFLPLGF